MGQWTIGHWTMGQWAMERWTMELGEQVKGTMHNGTMGFWASNGIGALHCTANELVPIAQLGLANSSFKRQAGYSSVGRASDCRTLQRSDGPWFDSGWPDISAWCSPMQRPLFYYCKRIHVGLLHSWQPSSMQWTHCGLSPGTPACCDAANTARCARHAST